MEIHIDTNKDSKEEIRRSIRMLQAYVGDNLSGYSNQQYGEQHTDSQNPDVVPDASPGMFNMFGGDSSNDNDDDKQELPQTYDEEEKEPDSPRVQIVEY